MKNDFIINEKLCPDVFVFTNRDSIPKKYKSNETIAIKDYFQEVLEKKEFYKLRKFWITGCPSIGKTTSLTILKSLLLKNNIIYKSFNLRKLNNDEEWNNVVDNILETINGSDIDVLILDSLDEIVLDEIRDKVFECIKGIDKPIIIASRNNYEMQERLNNYVKVELQEFNKDRIKEFLKVGVKDFNDETINIISNPMMLKLFIKLFKKAGAQERQSLLKLRKVPELLFNYFLSLYKQKEGEAKEGLLKNVEEELWAIGNYFFPTNKNKEKFEINKKIRGVFYEIDGNIESIHQEYIDFVCGFYLAKTLVKHPIVLF